MADDKYTCQWNAYEKRYITNSTGLPIVTMHITIYTLIQEKWQNVNLQDSIKGTYKGQNLNWESSISNFQYKMSKHLLHILQPMTFYNL